MQNSARAAVARWQDKSYKFAMNGQTGRMIGDLPISVPKFLGVLTYQDEKRISSLKAGKLKREMKQSG